MVTCFCFEKELIYIYYPVTYTWSSLLMRGQTVLFKTTREMKKIYKLFCLVVFVMLIRALPAGAQGATAFIDTFDGEFMPGPAGIPSTFYAINTVDIDYSGVQVGGTDLIWGTPFDPGHLTAWSDGLTGEDWAYASAPLSGYAAPFTPILSANPGVVTWQFNMRASIPNNGDFGTASNESVVVLAGSSPSFLTGGVGYAVTFTQSVPYTVKLIRYSAGLYGSLPVTIIAGSGTFMADGTDYVSVKVTFDPGTFKWSLYLRDDGPTAFASPFSGVSSLVGSTVDLTYVSGTPALTHFGFFEYNTLSLITAELGFSEFDNFKVSVDCGIPAFTGTDSVCVGSTSTLFNAMSGTWSSLATSIATVSPTTGVFTGVAAGTATIRYTTSAGCFRDTVIRVQALPLPITGTFAICQSATTTLSSATPGGFWGTSDGSIASISSSGVVTGVAPGTAIIAYTDLVSRCAATQVETINPTPGAISASGAICRGSTVTLSNGTPGGTWVSGNIGVATVGSSSGVVTGVTPGTATISYVMTGTGCYATTVVTINGLPTIAGNQVTCLGSTSNLTGGSPAGGNWSSSNTGVATIGSSSGVVTSVALGTTTITYTNPATGCYITRTQSVNAVPAAITGTAVVCQGSITTLSSTTFGGTWSSSNTGVATVPAGPGPGAVTGAGGGTATISYTVLSCSNTRVVTVNPLPAIITGPTSICLGSTGTLNDATPLGTWSSSNSAVVTIGSSTGAMNGVATGTSTVSYTLGTGCARSVVVSVNPLPAAITGTMTVCVNSTTTLDDATLFGTWSSGNTGVATVGSSTGVVTGVSAGTATISYSSPTTCATTAIVTVNPQPAAIGGPTSVCAGSTVTLTDITSGGTWTSGNTAVATIGSSTGYATGVAAGTSLISYTLISTGCQITSTLNVNPVPQPITGPSATCVGSTVTLSTTSTGGNWSSGNLAIATAGATTGAVTGTGIGTAMISYTFLTGCTTTRIETVNATPSSVITILSGDSVLCPGDFAMLTASSGAGFSYQWYVGGVPIPGAVSSTYSAGSAGAYQVSISNAAGCNATSIAKNISVNPVITAITTSAGSYVMCSGASITLDATTGAGLSYQWELGGTPIAGATAASYTATGGGDFTVVVTNTAGCSGSATATVTANPTPAGTVTLSGPLTFCQGSSVTMTAGSGLSYQWYNASGAIPGATGMSYTATVAGSYYMTETNAFGCSATSPTSVVVVNPLPNAAIVTGGPTIFCAGGSVTLNATAGGGLTYQWYRSGTAVPGATNPTYIAAVSGDYRVRVTNSATGCSALTAGDTIVTSVASTSILPLTPAQFCWGGSALLGASVSGPGTAGVTYQWYFGGIPIVAASGPTYNATVPGSYMLTISIPGSCTYTTTATTVTEKPLPNPIVSYNSATHVLSVQSYYVSYQWYKDLAAIPGANSATTIATGSAGYKVQVTDTNGCQSFSAAYPLTMTGGTGVANVNAADIKVYPNPAQSSVFVEAGMQVRAVVSGIDGRDVAEQSGNGTIEIDLKNLADGIYMIRIFHGDEQVKIEKVVKSTR